MPSTSDRVQAVDKVMSTVGQWSPANALLVGQVAACKTRHESQPCSSTKCMPCRPSEHVRCAQKEGGHPEARKPHPNHPIEPPLEEAPIE